MGIINDTSIKSIFAGIFIGLAGMVSGYSNYPELFFSVGLILVIFTQSFLYTGKVSHTIINKDGVKQLFIIIVGNFIGVSLIALYAKTFMDVSIFEAIAIRKYTLSYIHILFSSILCGSLMCIATSLNKNKNYLLIIVCVCTFMYCKFDHSIANMFYIYFTPFKWGNILSLFVAILGNAIGGKSTYKLMRGHDKCMKVSI